VFLDCPPQIRASPVISINARSAAEGNATPVENITSLRDAIGETNTAAAFVLRVRLTC
jgi:methyl-accepting chemotaxis protein